MASNVRARMAVGDRPLWWPIGYYGFIALLVLVALPVLWPTSQFDNRPAATLACRSAPWL